MTGSFEVDLQHLNDLMGQLRRFDRVLEWALEEADAQVARLHRDWTGAAADGHRAAHADWARGAADLRAGLTAMEQAATTAHANYSGAVDANMAMWRQVR